jgi:hypothetical protein
MSIRMPPKWAAWIRRPALVQDLHGPRVHAARPGLGAGPVGELVDHLHVHTRQAQFARQHQTRRAPASDHHIHHLDPLLNDVQQFLNDIQDR